MHQYRVGFTCVLAALLAVFVAGCGQETVTIPSVVSVTPIQGATDVIINTAVTATFNMAMNAATITATTFTVTAPGGAAVAGTVAYSGMVATFTPGANLAYGTTYTATITTGATSPGGTPLLANHVWTFSTIATPGPIAQAPMVTSTNPPTAVPAVTNVPLNQIVSASFNVPMNVGTIIAANFMLTDASNNQVAGTVEYTSSGNSLVFTPSGNLAPNAMYTGTIQGGSAGVMSQAGVAMANDYTWSFVTGTLAATTQPLLVKTVPADLAANVPLNQAISATFSEAMNPLTLNVTTFLLYPGPNATGTPIQAMITYDPVGFIATLKPTVLLSPNSTYTATVTTGAQDAAGNPLLVSVGPPPNPWTFTTGSTLITPPVVLGPVILQFGGLGGGAGMTNQGLLTVINNGGIATTGASTLITGFHDTSLPIVGAVWPCTYTETPLNMGQVNGLIDTAPPPPTVNCPNEGTAHTMAIATEAALEARIAYNTLQALPSGGVLAAELGGTTIYPGVYTNASSVAITIGDLTLDGQGDPNATWVFQIGSSLTVGDPVGPHTRSVILINGAKAGNVYWAVGGLPGAIINYGGGGTMVGTIISQPGITVSSPGQSTSSTVTTINGRVLALGAATTIVNTVINVPAQ
jgi:hypothetical protein